MQQGTGASPVFAGTSPSAGIQKSLSSPELGFLLPQAELAARLAGDSHVSGRQIL